MIQATLDRAVARSTGESLHTVRALGFGLPARLEPEDLVLAVACPFCGRPCPLDRDAGESPALAECDPCDVYFDYRPHEVYAAAAAELAAEAA